MISLCVIIAPYKIYAQAGLYYASNITSPGIKVGDYPTCINVNQEKNLIYVCNSGSDTISVIDGNTNTVISTIFAGGNFPNAIAVDPTTNRLYVGFAFSNTINEINTVTNTVTAPMPIENGTVNMISDRLGDLFVTTKNNAKITSIFAMQHYVNPNAFNFLNLAPSKRPLPCLNPAPDLDAMAFDGFFRLFVVKNTDGAAYVFNTVNRLSEGSFPIKACLGPQGIAFDPSTNMIYVANPDDGLVSVINGTAPYASIRNITIPYLPNTPNEGAVLPPFNPTIPLSPFGKMNITITSHSVPNAIAVNPKTHMVYVMDSQFGFVYAINSTCIIGDKECDGKPIKFSDSRHNGNIAVNPDRNMVYVTNPMNNTVSVIDGRTNHISVGINFKIDPSNSGQINCNRPNIHNITSSGYAMVDVGSTLTCEAKANSVFPAPFSYWSVFPPIWFDSWSGNLTSPDSHKDHIITFKPTHFGTLVAHFNVLSDAYITTILAIAIPAAAGLILKYSPLKDLFHHLLSVIKEYSLTALCMTHIISWMECWYFVVFSVHFRPR